MSCATFRLTPDFALGEFAVSESRPDLVEPVPDHLGPNVVRLAKDVLQPIRDRVGLPLRILSGYRSEALNEAIGGSETSQHRRAEAADFTTAGIGALFRDLMRGGLDLPIGQAVYYPAQVFVHIALPSQRYPSPTWCLHWPERGHRYRVLRGLPDLERQLDGATP